MKRTILALMAVLAMAGGARAEERRDHDLLTNVASEVQRYANYTIFDDVSASMTADGVVTLVGKVTMPYKRDDIARRVSSVTGIREVDNQLQVLPVSQFDDDLRYSIARSIYGNPTFWNYAAMINPPIHIVVERGHVTLAGVVSSQVDRTLARSLATSFGALSVTNALRTDAEMRVALARN